MNPKFLLKELCIYGKPLKLMHSIEGIEVDMENLSKDNTGLKIWKVAEEFCQFIAQNSELFHEKNIVELGCGTGLCGLFAGYFGRSVVITDGNDSVLELVKCNIHLNEFHNVHSFKLKWGENDSLLSFQLQFPEKIEVVIASETVYHETHVSLFLFTVKKLLERNGGLLIMAFAVRSRSILSLLYKEASNLGFVLIPTNFQFENKCFSANFSFKMLLIWRVSPSIHDVF
jgi:2-polyprenyl-3-methyl-5-hydroxy-6-metoxy-1,4-benzoquinol methylase